MNNRVSDGEILQLLIKEKNITIRELANLTGISEQTLYSMKHRKTNRTGKEILAKISKALHVPFGVWHMSLEEKMIRETFGEPGKIAYVDTDNMNKLLEYKKMPVEYIKYALDCIGYNNQYSIDDIKDIISNSVPIDEKLAEDIKYIVEHDQLIGYEEFNLLKSIRFLTGESKELIYSLIEKLSLSDRYEMELFNKMYPEKNEEE